MVRRLIMAVAVAVALEEQVQAEQAPLGEMAAVAYKAHLLLHLTAAPVLEALLQQVILAVVAVVEHTREGRKALVVTAVAEQEVMLPLLQI